MILIWKMLRNQGANNRENADKMKIAEEDFEGHGKCVCYSAVPKGMADLKPLNILPIVGL